MTEQMIPCRNPRLCGVQSHRPGTQTRCAATGRGSTAQASGKLAGTPRPATPGSQEVQATAGALQVLREDMKDFDERAHQLREQASLQIEAGMRKQFDLRDTDTLEVVHDTVTVPVDRVAAYYRREGGVEHRVVQVQSQYLPEEPKDGEVSFQNILDLADERKSLSNRRAKMHEAGLENAKAEVAKRKVNVKYDEVRSHESSMLGDSEFVQVNLYRRGEDQGRLLIPRDRVFPE